LTAGLEIDWSEFWNHEKNILSVCGLFWLNAGVFDDLCGFLDLSLDKGLKFFRFAGDDLQACILKLFFDLGIT
jgi:hypothetical protein